MDHCKREDGKKVIQRNVFAFQKVPHNDDKLSLGVNHKVDLYTVMMMMMARNLHTHSHWPEFKIKTRHSFLRKLK